VTTPQPGWYPDPASPRDSIRYWDGGQWTDRVAARPVPVAPPPPSAPLLPPPSAPPVLPSSPPPSPPVGTWPGSAPYGAAPGGTQMAPMHPSLAAYQAQLPGKRGPDGQLLSGWWRRAGGWLIDMIVIAVPALLVALAAEAWLRSTGRPVIDEEVLLSLQEQFLAGASVPSNEELMAVFGPGAQTLGIIVLAVLLLVGTVNNAVLVARNGRTVGDRLVGNRKVMAGRSIPPMATALARWLAKVLFWTIGAFVPLGFIVYWIDYLWPNWDARAQTLHDKMARTYVERADLAGPPVPR
jgi:hypothetical protein